MGEMNGRREGRKGKMKTAGVWRESVGRKEGWKWRGVWKMGVGGDMR